MSITITLSDIAWFIIFCIAVAIGVLLIILIRNVLTVIEKVNKIVDNSAGSIQDTIKVLPATLKSIDAAATSAKGTLDKANSIVDTVEDTVTDTIDSFSFNAENILNIVNITSAVVKSIIGAFSSKH